MGRPADGKNRLASTGEQAKGTGGWLGLDRRRFLQVVAATGLAGIVGAWTWRTRVHSQRRSPAAAASSDPIADLAASLDHDLERIFRFVQKEITYEPYAGILRGSKGTLLTRAGNSADQSLLLASLLAAGSHAVRFARGVLDDAKVQAIMASALLTADESVARTLRTMAGGEPPAAKTPPAARRLRDRAGQQLDAGIEAVGAALAKARISLPSSTPMPESERSRHTWVQVQDASGWRDLDPTLPTAAIGDRLTKPAEQLDSLPGESRHRVEFIATVERWLGSQLVSVPILEYAAFADELAGVPVSFTHVRADQVDSINIIGSGLGGSTNYNAVLEVGTRLLLGTSSITLGGASGDLFGGALSGGGEGIVDGEASAEWLDIRVAGPEGEPVTARRTIFDRIGDDMRASGSVDPSAVWPAELVDVDGSSGEFLPCRGLHAFSVVTCTVPAETLIRQPADTRLGVHAWLPLAYHYVRDALMAQHATDRGVRAFLARPGIASLSLRFAKASGTPVVEPALDIWHRGFGTLPLADRRAAHAPGLVAGVLSHAAERVISTAGLDDEPGALANEVSVGAIFEQSVAARVPLHVLRGELPADFTAPPEMLGRIRGVLASGGVVVIPEQAVVVNGIPRIGWWSIDPVSGHVEDQLDNGGGQATVEYNGKALLAAGALAIACLANFGDIILALVKSATAELGAHLPVSVDDALDNVADLSREYRERSRRVACIGLA